MKRILLSFAMLLLCAASLQAQKPTKVVKTPAIGRVPIPEISGDATDTVAGTSLLAGEKGTEKESPVCDQWKAGERSTMCEYDVKVPFDNGMTPEKRQEVIAHLNKILSDSMVLFVKISKYHWNVRSSNFAQLHAFFQKLYEQAFKDADLVAERVRALGGLALGTMKEFLGATHLGEVPERNPSAGDMIGDLLSDYQAIIKHIRSDIDRINTHDPISANMLMTIVEGQEKTAWMLRAHLEGLK